MDCNIILEHSPDVQGDLLLPILEEEDEAVVGASGEEGPEHPAVVHEVLLLFLLLLARSVKYRTGTRATSL